MYELFDHTADLGVRVTAPDLNSLFAEAGRALFAALVDNLEDVRAETEVRLEIEGGDREYLFFDWLNELLHEYESREVLLSEFDVQVTDTGLAATARGEAVDRDRHRLSHEVKAITYHGLKVEETGEGWRAEVIVDI